MPFHIQLILSGILIGSSSTYISPHMCTPLLDREEARQKSERQQLTTISNDQPITSRESVNQTHHRQRARTHAHAKTGKAFELAIYSMGLIKMT